MIALVFLLVFLAFKHKRNGSPRLAIGIVVFGLIEAYFIIHIMFCFEIGFPASAVQNNLGEYDLKPVDWLSFLGSYLGFAGAFLMAYLVYRQSQIIDMFTLSEYIPALRIKICDCTTGDFYIPGSIVQGNPKEAKGAYYTYLLDTKLDSSIEWEECGILLFYEIINSSKSIIEGVALQSVEIEEIMPAEKKIKYFVQATKWDCVNQRTRIFPGYKVKQCIYIQKIPKKLNLSCMTINFRYGGSQSFCPEVFISKEVGKPLMTFINESEPQ